MQIAVDYTISYGEPPKAISFLMAESRWAKGLLSENDYRAMMRVLIGTNFSTNSIAIRNAAEPHDSPDLTSDDILQKLGRERLRELAQSNTGRVSAWLLQEAHILEMDSANR